MRLMYWLKGLSLGERWSPYWIKVEAINDVPRTVGIEIENRNFVILKHIDSTISQYVDLEMKRRPRLYQDRNHCEQLFRDARKAA